MVSETKGGRPSRKVDSKSVKRSVSKSPVRKVKKVVKKPKDASNTELHHIVKRKITTKLSKPKTKKHFVKHNISKGGENENENDKVEGGGRKPMHKKMCKKKLSKYNIFVRERMCEMRKEKKEPVVELMKKIAMEWKAKTKD